MSMTAVTKRKPLLSTINKAHTRIEGTLTSRFQTRPSHQKSINVGLLRQLHTILFIHAPPIDHSYPFRRLLANRLLHPFPNLGVHFLCLLRGRHFPCANGPHGLIGNDEFLPVMTLNFLTDGSELLRDHFDSIVGLTLLESLAAAEDDAEAAIERGFGFVGDELS